jgi:hypothetical protein
MSVEADLATLQTMAPLSPDRDTGLSALPTLASLFAYMITCARAEDRDEADDCETLARFTQLTADQVRECAGILQALGYVVASTRLREIAGKRKHGLRPVK